MKVRLLALVCVAITATVPGAATPKVEVRVVRVDERATSSEVRAPFATATIRHAPGAVIRGDVFGTAAFVVADESDGDYGAALWRVDRRGATVLARGIYHASRPLASRDGRVYVERGSPGPAPRGGRLRTDALTLDALDPESGASQTLYAWSGYTLHVAGELGTELLVYRVGFEGADLVAVDRTSGRARVVTPLVPYARVLSVVSAGGALVMSNRDASDGHLWVAERVTLASGARERLFSARDRAPVPRILPNGDVASGTPPAFERLDEALR
jgi:hypothetical protein